MIDLHCSHEPEKIIGGGGKGGGGGLAFPLTGPRGVSAFTRGTKREVRKNVPKFPGNFLFTFKKKRVKSCNFSTRHCMLFFYRAYGRMRWSYRQLQCNTYITLRKIFTECDVYKSDEINETFSKNTCSNVMNNAIYIENCGFLVEN